MTTTRKRFATRVALPLVLSTAIVTWLTYDLFMRASNDVNWQDRQRTEQVVESAISALKKQIASLTADNATWDDAVRNTYGEINQDWINDSWGSITEGDHIYNASLLIEQASETPLAGYKKGKPFTPDMQAYFGGKLSGLLARFGENKLSPAAKAELIQTTDGLAVVGIAPILPISEDLKIPQPTPRYLILVRFLTPEFVSELGKTNVVDTLTLSTPTENDSQQFLLRAEDGTSVASATWRDGRPGDKASKEMLPFATGALAVLLAAMTLVGAFCWRLVSELARKEEASRRDALHDALTGLPNRKSLKDLVDKAIAEKATDIALAFVDLDGFKEVNDTYDHATGDRLIKLIATNLIEVCKDKGVVHRLGGDEFVGCFTGHGARSEAEEFAAATLKFLVEPFNLDGRMASVGASIGIANSFGEQLTSNELMRRADVAMYKAKSQGKNQFVHFFSELEVERKTKKAVLDSLRQILDRDSLDVAYMPIVDARSGTIKAVEALARWPEAFGKAVSPDLFVSIAESSGCIDALSRIVLSKACRTVKAWPDIRLCFNVSPVQFNNPAFVDDTVGIIRQNGFDPARVEIEITENTLVQDMPRVRAAIAKLRAAGIKVALDDFGKGYSSFHYLHDLKFDRIKIDRSLVSHISDGTEGLLIVQGAVTMAKGLGAAVTAEGVETEEQMIVLGLAGCAEMQGYYFSAPTTPEAVTNMLRMSQASVV